jgi:hypothetical protein
MAGTPDPSAAARRAELQAWYVQRLLPKLERAARSGVADARSVAALHAEMRALLELEPPVERAA